MLTTPLKIRLLDNLWVQFICQVSFESTWCIRHGLFVSTLPELAVCGLIAGSSKYKWLQISSQLFLIYLYSTFSIASMLFFFFFRGHLIHIHTPGNCQSNLHCLYLELGRIIVKCSQWLKNKWHGVFLSVCNVKHWSKEKRDLIRF